ncbi:RDD family protein [Reyranella massiliensis]|uniref:RDD family protein n=1 Tax=Reyranella massiliensis TaxID=445220 RepID=UPI0002E8065B|nr:RDD family protein [Reyranella massiliensis]
MASVPDSGPAAPPPPPVWNAQPAGQGQVAYGGFWVRFLAYIIDSILLNIVIGIIAAIMGVNIFDMNPEDAADFNPMFSVVVVVIVWLYFALMESSERGATLGKMALGLRVVSNSGQRLSFLNATGRYFAKILSAIILCIGFLMIAFTDRKRGLHDMIAGTLVVKYP